MKPLCCPIHPDGLIRHSWDLTQTVLNGIPSGEGVKSNHKYECADCGIPLASLAEATAADNASRRIAKDTQKAMDAITNGWQPIHQPNPTVQSLIAEFSNISEERKVLHGENDESARVWKAASTRLEAVKTDEATRLKCALAAAREVLLPLAKQVNPSVISIRMAIQLLDRAVQ